jgi:5-formyltetrahydrofolate cyclo-ligase
MSDEVARNVLALPAIEDARTVMAFASFGSEVDTGPIIEGLAGGGRRVVLPRVEGRVIVPVSYRSGDPVMPSSFGALEPAEGEPVGPKEIDVVIVPGLAFDRSGHRVGYGRGFYDRFLGLLRPDALTMGICFSVQLVEEVPHGRGDRPVDLVVTEQGVERRVRTVIR